eukprot:2053291-Rhodomonas_salina.1
MSEEGRNTRRMRRWKISKGLDNVENVQGHKSIPNANPGTRSVVDQEAFDATNGNDGVARLAAQLHALQIEMQTLRERSQDPPRNVPASVRQTEYVNPGIAARLGRAHARMDGPSPTGSEPDNR